MSGPERTEVPERWTVAEGSEESAEGRDRGSSEAGTSEPGGTDADATDAASRRPTGDRPGSSNDTRDRRQRIDRSRARAWALQILYRWESGGMKGSLLEALEETGRTRRIAPTRVPRIERLLEVVDDRLPEVDRAIDGALDNWRLERLSTIDRAVLRIGAAELLFMEDIPPRASIQEAVRLADQYGGDESARFVNGVLDALYHR